MQLTCSELWSRWRATLLKKAHLYCTKFIAPSKQHSPPKPWMTQELTDEIRQKHRLFQMYMRNKCEARWSAFCTQRNKVCRLVRDAKSRFVQARTGAPDTSSVLVPKLHKMMSSLKASPKVDVPDICLNGNTVSDAAGKASAFNDFFIAQNRLSVGDSSEDPPAIACPPVTSSFLETISTTPEEIATLLSSLDPLKSPGDDGVPTRLLKLTADEIAPSLAHLFNTSFSSGELPQQWREATVVPIHKKGNRSVTTNYRPISLLSVIAKVQERVVHSRLSAHIKPYLPPEQSGFRSGDGTELQLARLLHEISGHRDCGNAVVACFFDLSKAFDRVWHAGMIKKLHHCGVRGPALDWLTAYLCTRRQRVRINDVYSDWSDIPAGVPQGSVLGPLLFVIYTIDLPSACSSDLTRCSQFADDTALISTHKSFAQAQEALQSSVSSAATWLQQWHLLVNAQKTVTMSFQASAVNIQLGSTDLQQVSCHRHLGVLIQDNLRWDRYVEHIINKAKRSLHNLHRLRGTLTTEALGMVYLTYIRPVLEYATIVISNMSSTCRDQLERLQRKAARICLRLPLFTPVHHTALLHRVKWPTLTSRQRYRQALLAHSLTHGPLPEHLERYRAVHQHPDVAHRLRNPRTFTLLATRTSRHRDSPLNSAKFIFNNLPASSKSIADKSLFEKDIKHIIISSVCECADHPNQFAGFAQPL